MGGRGFQPGTFETLPTSNKTPLGVCTVCSGLKVGASLCRWETDAAKYLGSPTCRGTRRMLVPSGGVSLPIDEAR